MMRVTTVMLSLLVAGCVTPPPLAGPTGPCVVDGRVKMRFAGVKFRAAMRPEIEQATNAAMSRILRPGDAATMDLREDRLNIVLDDGGQIDDLRCG